MQIMSTIECMQIVGILQLIMLGIQMVSVFGCQMVWIFRQKVSTSFWAGIQMISEYQTIIQMIQQINLFKFWKPKRLVYIFWVSKQSM